MIDRSAQVWLSHDAVYYIVDPPSSTDPTTGWYKHQVIVLAKERMGHTPAGGITHIFEHVNESYEDIRSMERIV